MTVNPLESSPDNLPNAFAQKNDDPLLISLVEAEEPIVYEFQEWLEFVKANRPAST